MFIAVQSKKGISNMGGGCFCIQNTFRNDSMNFNIKIKTLYFHIALINKKQEFHETANESI